MTTPLLNEDSTIEEWQELHEKILELIWYSQTHIQWDDIPVMPETATPIKDDEVLQSLALPLSVLMSDTRSPYMSDGLDAEFGYE
jgi:hypothetical protein